MSNSIPGVLPKNGTSANIIYWQIFNGQLARKSHEGEEGAVKRTNKKKNVVWEVYERGVSGVLHDVNLFESTFDDGTKLKTLVVKLKKDGYIHAINIPYDSKYYGDFMKKLANLNVNQEIQFSPYNYIDKDSQKKRIGVSIVQAGNKVQSAYEKWVDKKCSYLLNFPPFPQNWSSMDEREQKQYFWKVEDFYKARLAEWRAKYAPKYDKYEQHEQVSTPPPAQYQSQNTDWEDDSMPF